jgi:hypothetical protein
MTPKKAESLSMTPKQWIIGVVVAAVSMLGAAQAFVYPRSEGEKTEKRVITLEARVDSREDRFEDILRSIDGRLSNLEGRFGVEKANQ